MSKEDWVNKCAARIKEVSGMDNEEAAMYAQIYLDDVLNGDTGEDPEQAADDAMDDWR